MFHRVMDCTKVPERYTSSMPINAPVPDDELFPRRARGVDSRQCVFPFLEQVRREEREALCRGWQKPDGPVVALDFGETVDEQLAPIPRLCPKGAEGSID